MHLIAEHSYKQRKSTTNTPQTPIPADRSAYCPQEFHPKLPSFVFSRSNPNCAIVIARARLNARAIRRQARETARKINQTSFRNAPLWGISNCFGASKCSAINSTSVYCTYNLNSNRFCFPFSFSLSAPPPSPHLSLAAALAFCVAI